MKVWLFLFLEFLIHSYIFIAKMVDKKYNIIIFTAYNIYIVKNSENVNVQIASSLSTVPRKTFIFGIFLFIKQF